MDFFLMFMKMIIALVVVVFLMVACLRITNNTYRKTENKSFKVIDRVQIGKESFITIIKVGDKGYILSNTANSSEKVDTLTKEEVEQLEAEKKNASDNMQEMYKKLTNIKKWTRRKGQEEEKYE